MVMIHFVMTYLFNYVQNFQINYTYLMLKQEVLQNLKISI
jgi:hypothetical protein